MTDPADFLSRWSRRKREAAKDDPERKTGPDDDAPEPAVDGEPDAAAAAGEQDKDKGKKDTEALAAEDEREEPAFDLSQLPSIESITAETDIRPFLARGVPSGLRQAALRRLWSVDPKIRDFIEMAENQWDFNAPGEILGFDFSPPAGDVKRMVADILGGGKPAGDSETEAQPEAFQPDEAVPAAVPTEPAAVSHRDVTGPLQDDQMGRVEFSAAPQREKEAVRRTLVVQNDEADAATQQDIAAQEGQILPVRRSHGRAMPK